ncbi:hypothetical protein [Litoreibacter albidus]|uniref:hypothetical protein n=1 Tax=Litoreibacter albidus TaxID=670155 RepID=UPI003736B757
MAKQKARKIPTIETVNIGAAAVDIGSREHMAEVNPVVTDARVRARLGPSLMICMISLTGSKCTM